MKKQKKVLLTIFFILFLLGAVVFTALSVRDLLVQKKAQKDLDRLVSLTSAQPTPEGAFPIESLPIQEKEPEKPSGSETQAPDIEETPSPLLDLEKVAEELGIDEIPQKNIDWDMLREENEEIYAWIYLPGSKVDYPILQHTTGSDDYYLDHNLDHSQGYPGCLYTHREFNAQDFLDPVTVIYGHNMGYGTMFGSLHGYESASFLEEHPYFYIYTPDGTYVYEIFAVCEHNDRHIMYSYDFTSEKGRKEYIEDLWNVRKMNSHVRMDTGVSADKKIVTLSTCFYNRPSVRWLVSGVLQNDPSPGN